MKPRPIHILAGLVLAACLSCPPARAEAPAGTDSPEASPAPASSAVRRTGSAPSEAAVAQSAEPAPPSLPTSSVAQPAAPAEPAEPAAATDPPAPAPPATAPAAPEGADAPSGPAAPKVSLPRKVVQKVLLLGKTAEKTHDFLEHGILQQVINLDNFFGTANSKKELHASYLLRWRNSLRWQKEGGFNLGSTLRANFDLSRISDRLQLSISGEDQPDQFAPSLPEDPGNPGFDRTFQNARFVNTEVRYQLINTAVTDLFLGTGVDLALPPQLFARARFQRFQRLSDTSLLRFAETIFAKTPYGVGETTELSFERSLDPKTVVRWASSGTLSQEFKAMEWGSELWLLHELSPSSAVTLVGGIYGNTSLDDWINNYRVFVRYRHNFLRSWLFYELEPQVAWPRNSDGNFPVNYAFTVRLEVVFQGVERNSVNLP